MKMFIWDVMYGRAIAVANDVAEAKKLIEAEEGTHVDGEPDEIRELPCAIVVTE